MAPSLSLVLPAFHEARRLPPTWRALEEFCEGFTAGEIEVLIIVARSADGTLDVAQALAARQAETGGAHRFEVVDNRVQRGKGFAVRTGMLRARGELLFYMDADLSVPLREVRAFAAEFAARPELDVLVGNRQHARSRITRAQGWLRRSMGQAFNRVLAGLGAAELRDTQCGFKAFRRRAAREIFSRQRLDGFAFDVEVLLLAQRLDFGVADLPVEWINSPESHVHILRDSARMLADALRVRRLVDRTLAAERADASAALPSQL